MTEPHPPHSSAARPRILIIRPSALGDVCRSVPVLASLRKAFPTAIIDWLVQDTFAAAIESHPDLSNVVSFPRAKLGAWYLPTVAPEVKRYLDDLARRGYDLVLDCQGLFRSGIFAMATRAPRRIGFENAAELGWLGLTDRVEAPRDLHTVDRMLLLAQAAGAEPVYDLRLYSASADRAWAEQLPDLAGRSYIVIAPTTRWPGKQWPGERFAQLAGMLLSAGACERIALVGSAGEREQAAEVIELSSRDPRVVDMFGKTSVGQLMALIERSSGVVGCDSAAVHMAVGFNRPLAALYGPTRVERVGPYGRSAQVIQRLIPGDTRDHKDAAGGQRIMRRITVEEVADLLIGQLTSKPAASPLRY